MKFDLDGKICLVTGGSRGIGFEIARSLLAENAKVIICGRKEESLEKAKEALLTSKDLMPENLLPENLMTV